MMKKIIQTAVLLLVIFVLPSCDGGSKQDTGQQLQDSSSTDLNALLTGMLNETTDNPFIITLNKETPDYYIPAIHSAVQATYLDMWIILGGQVVGFHGTSNNPPPFMSGFANDSIWVIDPAHHRTYGVPVPAEYKIPLLATNSQSFQSGSILYMCGGYTVSDLTQTRFNTTSNYLFKISLPDLISYVQSGAKSPSLDKVFPVVIKDDFVRVSGGEMHVENNRFFLIGGQNYQGAYSIGKTGKYTNAIRCFNLKQNGNDWQLSDLDSLVDGNNLHRRDFNLLPYSSNNNKGLIITGGVFNPDDLSYNNPVFITGLNQSKPSIKVGTKEQMCNQYTCAYIPLGSKIQSTIIYALLGGITYKQFDPDSGRLVIGDKGIDMPFSNLVNYVASNMTDFNEYVQLPPNPLLPGYLGSNAWFIPDPSFLMDGSTEILDMSKIFYGNIVTQKIGFLYGGILSNGPTSGTTPKGHVNTYANRDLYSVTISLNTNVKAK